MKVVWERLILFVAVDGRVLRGEPIMPSPDFDLGNTTEQTELRAKVILGSDVYDTSGKTKVSDEIVTVKRLLAPLAQEDVDILRCVGLNYAEHSRLAHTTTIWPFHLADVLNSSNADIWPKFKLKRRDVAPRHSLSFSSSRRLASLTTARMSSSPRSLRTTRQTTKANWEVHRGTSLQQSAHQLITPQVIVIGKDAKNVSAEQALEYVAAYTCGNDISSRKLQRDPAFAGRIPQWGFYKGFDTFAPIGPCLVNAALIGDPKKLYLKTMIDGDVRQGELVADLLFDCGYLISYLSSGTTLRKGSIIMTGTPGGTLLFLSRILWAKLM
jgi:2-keto-4-pentenoate hydratase/2-oxohepta-3-ene-1,7-dioic acid hydratase in catechol pathway